MVTKFVQLVDERVVEPGTLVKIFDLVIPNHELWTARGLIISRAPGEPLSEVDGEARITPMGVEYSILLDRFSMSGNVSYRTTPITVWGEADRVQLFLQTTEPVKLRSFIPIVTDTAVYRDTLPPPPPP